jgi:uncharacterized peroxidase-related enzyme
VKRDFRTAPLSARERLICEFSEKLTLRQEELGPLDLERLRVAGLTDADILDLVQIASYFNYINRVAHALGVEPEDFMEPDPKKAGKG